MTITNRKSALSVLAMAGALALSACGGEAEVEADAPGQSGDGTESIAALIADADELSTVEQLIEDAGLSDTFDAAPHYTIFAPDDEALAALGETFGGDSAQAAMVAVLRDHVVGGYFTREDIMAAVEANGGSVDMRTMGEGTLRFAMDGDDLTVTSSDGGASAVLREEMIGSNGVVLPVDGVLKSVSEEG